MKDLANPQLPWASFLDKQTLKAVSLAFKCLEKGEASPDQQKLALDFLIKIGCRTYDSDWFLEERISCFAAGRRYVGQQIVELINIKIGKIEV